LAYRSDLFPRLRNHRRGLDQHAEETEGRGNLHCVFGLDPPSLGHEAVDFLDAALRVPSVPAHVPLSHRAVGAGDRIGTPYDAHDEIALPKSFGRTRVDHATERLMAQHEPRFSRRSPTILTLHHLDIGPADTDRNGFHQHGSVALIGLRDILQPRGPRLLRFYRDGFHMVPS
jgi:hypothetical protein